MKLFKFATSSTLFASTAHLFVWQECAGRVHLSSEKRIISELKETSSWRERERERGIYAREGESRLNSHMRHNERAFNVWKGAMPLYCSFCLDEGKFVQTFKAIARLRDSWLILDAGANSHNLAFTYSQISVYQD